jgi:hypothetical protein
MSNTCDCLPPHPAALPAALPSELLPGDHGQPNLDPEATVAVVLASLSKVMEQLHPIPSRDPSPTEPSPSKVRNVKLYYESD